MIDIAKKNAEEENAEISLLVSDIRKLEPSKKYDAVICNNMHSPEILPCLKHRSLFSVSPINDICLLSYLSGLFSD